MLNSVKYLLVLQFSTTILRGVVKNAMVATKSVNTLAQLGYTSHLEAELGLSSTMEKILNNWENSGCSISKFFYYREATWLFSKSGLPIKR